MQVMIEDMESLVEETCAMADLSISMLERSVEAITEEDSSLADSITSDLERIERMDDEIEDAALQILCRFQPTASDARTVAAVLKSITHLERIAKYAANIAVATKYLEDKPSYPPLTLIKPVAEKALGLVRLVVNGFRNSSIDGFDTITERDDSLDASMKNDIQAIVAFINENEGSADVCIYYISVLKFLERVGDHACKMAEKVSYMVTGERATIA